MSKDKILLFLIVVLTLLTISYAAASENGTDTGTAEYAASENNVETVDNTKEITKTSMDTLKTNTTKSDTHQTSVSNYDELVQKFDEAKTMDYHNLIIDLEDGDYTITKSISFNESNVDNIVINGNNQVFKSKDDMFITVYNNYTLTLNDLVFKDVKKNVNVPTIRDWGNLTLNNVKISGLDRIEYFLTASGGLLIRDSEISDNNLNKSFMWAGMAKIRIINTEIKNNIVRSDEFSESGLIYSFMISDICFDNLTASDNSAHYGALVCGFDDTNITFKNSILYNNRANVGGVVYGSNFNLEIDNTQFTSNNAKSVGGAIAVKRRVSDEEQKSQIAISNSVFHANNGGTSGGGAIYAEDTDMEIENTEFINNTAYFGGAICHLGGNLGIYSSVLVNNTADYYGGSVYLMYIENGLMEDSIFSDNYAEDDGGVLLIAFSQDIDIIRSIIENGRSGKSNDLVSLKENVNVTIINSVLMGSDDTVIDEDLNDEIHIDNNWWGENNPDFDKLSPEKMPDTWYVADKKFSPVDEKTKVTVTLDTDNNGNKIQGNLPTRLILFTSDTGSFEKDVVELNEVGYTYYNGDINDAYAQVDNEIMKFNTKLTPYMHGSNVYTIVNDTVMLKLNVNEDITGTFTLKVDDKTLAKSLTQRKGNVSYTLSADYGVGNHSITWTFSGDNKYSSNNIARKLTVLENKTVETIIIPLKNNSNNITVENITEFPDRYDLRELGLVTQVKDQGKDGVCWTFGTYNALESNILKATGLTYDFSENNMKDILRKYSFVGDNMYPTDGGLYQISTGYLASLYGPVLEEYDPYDEDGTISPLLDIEFPVYDAVFITPRQNALDNNEIKAAIMNYGAVSASIYINTSYFDESKTNYYYPNNGSDHGIAIIGWDDNYSREHFQITLPDTGETVIPEGDGAFIIKNSWGTDVGEEGYQYVSYYDKSLATYNIPFGIVGYVINNTENYTGAYEYDTTANDVIELTVPKVWIKNIYTAEEDSTIKAVGTMFLADSYYTINIYKNDNLVHSQNGETLSGYHTIKLDKYLHMAEGDEFAVEIALATKDGSTVNLIIQDAVEYKRPDNRGVSLISEDGIKYDDMIDLENPAYLVIKAYTGDVPIPETTTGIDSNVLTVTTNLNATGSVTYYINGEIIGKDVPLVNGKAYVSYDINDLTGESILITSIIVTDDNIYEQNVTIPLVKSGDDKNHSHKIVPKNQGASWNMIKSTKQKQFDVIVDNHIIYTGNVITLGLLNRIFNESFINGHLLVYLDGKLVFNDTVSDDLSLIIIQIIEDLIGNHELKVVFTDSHNHTDTYIENITIK